MDVSLLERISLSTYRRYFRAAKENGSSDKGNGSSWSESEHLF
jgi:hypothetical protein